MDKLKQLGKVVWNWTLSRVEMVHSLLPPDFISSPLAKWVGGAAFVLLLVVSILLGDGKATRLEIVQAVIAMFGLAGLAANAAYTLKRANAIEKQVKVSDNAQITERFSRAIEHLGSGSPQIMIGGIYALERIAKDYQKDYHQTVMEVLTAFIRGFVREEPIEKVPPELQAAVTVVCRRDIEWEKENLPDFVLDLSGANLNHLLMQKAKLVGAELFRANLTGASLYRANLTDANLADSDLSKAFLIKTNLTKTRLQLTELNQTLLIEADMNNTIFAGAKNLTAEQVLAGNNYREAVFTGDIRYEMKAILKQKEEEAKSVNSDSNEQLDSVEDKLPDADVTEPGESQDEPGSQQEDEECGE